MKPKPKRMLWIGLRLLLIGMSVSAIALAGVVIWQMYQIYDQMFGPPKPIRSLSRLSRGTGLNYPAGAVLIDGTEYFRVGGSDLGARVRIPEADLARFLTQPPQPRGYAQEAPPSPKVAPTVAQMSATIRKAIATPSKRMTRTQIEFENITLDSLKLGPVWRLERVRHLLWVEREEVSSGESLRLAVDLDDPQLPLVHIIYWSQ